MCNCDECTSGKRDMPTYEELEEALSVANQRIAELEKEIVRLSGKTGFCVECERLARENKELRAYKQECEKAEAVGYVNKCDDYTGSIITDDMDEYGEWSIPLYTRPSPDLQKRVAELEEYCRQSDSVATDLQKENEELKRKLAEQQAWIKSVVDELLAPLAHYPDIAPSLKELSQVADGFGQLSVGMDNTELQALLADARKLPEGWAEAVNLARNLSTGEWNQISTKGVLALCDTILRVDSIRVAPKPEVK